MRLSHRRRRSRGCAAATEDLAPLERYKPLLRFDRRYDHLIASVTGMVENPGTCAAPLVESSGSAVNRR